MTKVSSVLALAFLCTLSVADEADKPRSLFMPNRHQASAHRRVTGEPRHAKIQHRSRSSVARKASDGIAKVQNEHKDHNSALMRREKNSLKASVTVGSKATLQTQRLAPSVATSMADKDVAASAVCTSRCAGRTTTTAACFRSCESSLQRLRSAAELVAVEEAEVRKIPFPHMRSPPDKSGKKYNGMMFAGGANIGGHDSFVARICTSNCADDTAAGLFSKIVVGQLKPSLVWKEVSVLQIPHSSNGMYVGPEDPRLDIVNGSRFVLANVNVDVKGCQLHPTQQWKNPRQMFFSPVDAIPDAQPCLVQLAGEDPCRVQKNWAPLVPLHSSEIYFVYSLSPLRVLRFDKKTCAAASMTKVVPKDSDNLHGTHQLHGGSRFVHGLSVPGGELYVSFAHTAPPEYEQLLVAVLLQHPGDSLEAQEPSFRLIGVSCPIRFSKAPPGDAMMIATSIISFDSKTDLARVTYQQHDSENYLTEVRGVGHWLEATYAEFLKAGPTHCTAHASTRIF